MATNKTVVTFRGKPLTAKQLSAKQKQWAAEDKKFWAAAKKADIARQKVHITKLKKLPKTPLRDRLISSSQSELKRLQAKRV